MGIGCHLVSYERGISAQYPVAVINAFHDHNHGLGNLCHARAYLGNIVHCNFHVGRAICKFVNHVDVDIASFLEIIDECSVALQGDLIFDAHVNIGFIFEFHSLALSQSHFQMIPYFFNLGITVIYEGHGLMDGDEFPQLYFKFPAVFYLGIISLSVTVDLICERVTDLCEIPDDAVNLNHRIPQPLI